MEASSLPWKLKDSQVDLSSILWDNYGLPEPASVHNELPTFTQIWVILILAKPWGKIDLFPWMSLEFLGHLIQH